jgi:hypothetical protein
MRAHSKIFAIAVLAVGVQVVLLGACGGSSDAPSGPLAKRFDDMYIAAIPLDQKQSVVTTQNDWSVAKMQNAKAEADFNESNTLMSIVRNDQKAARLGVESALASKKSAEASADTNRMNQATRDLHNAEGLVKAADARVKYYEAYREYLKVELRHAQDNMYWREAQYELAKAQLGQKSNIAPKGVSYDAFPRQEEERSKRAASTKQRVDDERRRAQSARESWLKAQETADRDNGRSTNLPDPLGSKSASSQ